MPLSGGKYVAPHWVNNSAPALDAAELQAICDTVVKNQGSAESLQKAIQTLTNTVGGKAATQVVSYTGTGTYGQNNPNRVTFSFPPKFVCVGGIGSNSRWATAIFIKGQVGTNISQAWGNCWIDGVRFSGNYVEWYSIGMIYDDEDQLNASGRQYVAFGIE